MYKNLKSQISLISLILLTNSPVAFAAESSTATGGEKDAQIVDVKHAVSPDAAPLMPTETGDSGVVSGADVLTKVGSGTLILSGANTYDGASPDSKEPTQDASKTALVVAPDKSALDGSPVVLLDGAALSPSGDSPIGVSSPPQEKQLTGASDVSVALDASSVQPLGAIQSSVSLSVSTDSLKSSGALEQKMVEVIIGGSKTTKLGVHVLDTVGKLSSLTVQFYRATEGKIGLDQLPVQRILNVSGSYPVAVAAVLTGMEAVFDHNINLNAKGRALLNIRPDEKVRISHLFQGVGTSLSAVVPAMIYSNKGDQAAITVLRSLAHRGYIMFDTPGSVNNARYSDEGLNKFLSIVLGGERFQDGIIEGNSLYIRVFNTQTGSTDVLSNSPSFPTHKELSLGAAVKAASVTSDLFPPQTLPLRKEDGPFREAEPDSGFSIYQKNKTVNNISYEILSIGSDVKEFKHDSSKAVERENNEKLSIAIRKSPGVASALQCCTEVDDLRAPLTSFASLQLREDQLGKVDDYRPSHVRKMVDIGLEALDSEVFKLVVEQLGFRMPDADAIKRIKVDIRRRTLYDLPSSTYSELSSAEQSWLHRGVLAMTQDFNFAFYRELNRDGKLIGESEKQILLNAVVKVITQELGKEKWCKKWSTKDLSLSEGILRGCEFTSLIQKSLPLNFQQICDGDEKSITAIIDSFIKPCNAESSLYKNTSVDDYSPYLARIFWTYMLSDVKDVASPETLRQFQKNCLVKANKTISAKSSFLVIDSMFRSSREWTLADDLTKYLDELFGSAIASAK